MSLVRTDPGKATHEASGVARRRLPGLLVSSALRAICRLKNPRGALNLPSDPQIARWCRQARNWGLYLRLAGASPIIIAAFPADGQAPGS